jgi:hypothetical protein
MASQWPKAAVAAAPFTPSGNGRLGDRSRGSRGGSDSGGHVQQARRIAMNTAQTIKEHMEVLGSDGQHVGTVDHIEGKDKIKLTKTDAKAGGKHHLIPMNWVDHVDSHVHLNKSCKDAMAQWQAAA